MRSSYVPDLAARQLHAVLSVAEYGSFIAAAAFLQTSQPALTRTIKRVEDVLGVRLFDRTTRRVEITTAGKEFVSVAERMLNDLRISVRSVRKNRATTRQIIISASCRLPISVLRRSWPATVQGGLQWTTSVGRSAQFSRTCGQVSPIWASPTLTMFLILSPRRGFAVRYSCDTPRIRC
jgi:hypothetical protein